MSNLIIVVPVDDNERGDVEAIEGHPHDSKEVQEMLDREGVYYYSLSEFVDLCNDEYFNEVGSWITHVKYDGLMWDSEREKESKL